MPEKTEAREFFVDTNFQKRARRPGGVPRDRALEHAQAQIDTMQADFGDWLTRELQNLDGALQDAERKPDNKTAIDEAYANSCQLRDVGATMGFKLLSFVAGDLCEILDTIRNGAAYDRDTIQCHVSALHLSRQGPYRNLGPEQVPELSNGLQLASKLAGKDSSRPA
jgi:hypothetical protein